MRCFSSSVTQNLTCRGLTRAGSFLIEFISIFLFFLKKHPTEGQVLRGFFSFMGTHKHNLLLTYFFKCFLLFFRSPGSSFLSLCPGVPILLRIRRKSKPLPNDLQANKNDRSRNKCKILYFEGLLNIHF